MGPTTQNIVERERATHIHAASATPEGWVSTRSVWTHDAWLLDASQDRLRDAQSTISFEGLSVPVANIIKVLAWSLLVSRPHGRKPVAISSMPALGVRLQHLGRWMMRHRHRSLANLTPVAIQNFRDELKREIREREKERADDLAPGTVASYLMPFQYMHEQRRHFEALGLRTMPEEPFPDSSARAAAEEIAADVDRFIPPIPDEVVLPIVRAAYGYLGAKADDILRLQAAVLKHRVAKGEDTSNEIINRRIRDELVNFKFSGPGDDEEPWHPPLATFWNEGTRDSAFHRVRLLLCDLMVACLIVVRFQSGIRSGELFTFEPGLDGAGMPNCVEVEQSISGAYQLFFVKGEVSKGFDHPEATRWLLGSRPSETAELPAVVRALVTLDRLAAPWREWSTSEAVKRSLLVQFGFRGIARSEDMILPLGSHKLDALTKDFIGRHIDLSHLDREHEVLGPYVEANGRNVQGKQWRKTYANFMIRTDRRLLSALAQQFQHASTAITQVAYVGKDPIQLGLVDSAAMEKAMSFVTAALDGQRATSGRVVEALNDGLADLREKTAGLSGEERGEMLKAWFVERDIRIFLAPHGKCIAGLLPGENRCHEEASTLDWSNQAPNFAARNPRLCTGCRCFGVDAEDAPFWEARYRDNKRIWDEAEARGLGVHYTVARERYLQSEKFLRALGVTPPARTEGVV